VLVIVACFLSAHNIYGAKAAFALAYKEEFTVCLFSRMISTAANQ
jgi:hypothetical protein